MKTSTPVSTTTQGATRRYGVEKRSASRFTFHQFCIQVWNMSQKDDLHFIDFKNTYQKELKTLYLKSR